MGAWRENCNSDFIKSPQRMLSSLNYPEVLVKPAPLLFFHLELAQVLADEPGVGEHSKQRVVDFVRHRGGEAAERGHLLAPQKAGVRAFESVRLFINALFERTSPLAQFGIGARQLLGHSIE